MKKETTDRVILDPAWLCKTAALAMRRWTAIVFSADRSVYGILPRSGGSINVFYDADPAWVDAVLARFPAGAVFPNDNVFGGSITAKLLRPYANLRVPEDGTGQAWVDRETEVLHVKCKGTAVHSAAFAANNMPAPVSTDGMEEFSLNEGVTKDIGKLLIDFTQRNENRPMLKRIYGFIGRKGSYLGSTDGKSAIMHKMAYVPEGFSVDPCLVNIFDIVGYCNEVTPSGATVHSYRLADSTVFVEKLAEFVPPQIPENVDAIGIRGKTTLLASAAVRLLDESITSLGVGLRDSYGGVIVFASDGVTVLSESRPVADFDVCACVPKGNQVMMAAPILSRIARLGGDLQVASSGNGILFSENAGTRIIGMPIVPKVAEGAKA